MGKYPDRNGKHGAAQSKIGKYPDGDGKYGAAQASMGNYVYSVKYVQCEYLHPPLLSSFLLEYSTMFKSLLLSFVLKTNRQTNCM